jgi:hypothetical protein
LIRPIHFRRKRSLAGSSLNAPEQAPAQEPAIPLAQLTPTENEVNVVADALGLKRVVSGTERVTKRKTPEREAPSPREQFHLTRRDIANLLDQSGVESALQPFEVRQYRKLASGNLSEGELAKEVGMRNEIGIGVYITELETRIIRRALLLGIRLEQKTGVETDTYDRTMDADRAADEKHIEESGGAAIGGSIISAGERFGKKEGTTFRPGKALDSFERSGQIQSVPGGSPDRDLTGGEVDSDDYGEESGA